MASIEIFIGAPIEHASERVALARAVEYLTAQGLSAVVIANVNLKTRQIDLIIALDQGVLVVEAKAFASMVRGGENGFWELCLASGRWKQIPNAYQQTIDEKHAVRDAMADFAGAVVPFPDTSLVFAPDIPARSSIPPSDFKLGILGSGVAELRTVGLRLGNLSLHSTLLQAVAQHSLSPMKADGGR